MKNYKISCIILSVLFAFTVKAQTNDSTFSISTLAAIRLCDNNTKALYQVEQDNQAVLFLFLSPDCPLCKNYSLTLNALYQQYKNNIQFYGIIPGYAYTSQEINNFKSAYQISFPLLSDTGKQLTNYLHATTTPQVILLNEQQRLLYKGAIDNWAVSIGKQRLKPTEFYLDNALQNTLRHQPIAIKRTTAVGCKINDF